MRAGRGAVAAELAASVLPLVSWSEHPKGSTGLSPRTQPRLSAGGHREIPRLVELQSGIHDAQHVLAGRDLDSAAGKRRFFRDHLSIDPDLNPRARGDAERARRGGARTRLDGARRGNGSDA